MEYSAIHRAFESMTKDKLVIISDRTGYYIPKHTRKAEFVDALERYFRHDPARLLLQLPIYEVNILLQLCRTPKDKCLRFNMFSNQLYIIKYGLCNCVRVIDTPDKVDLWLSEDVQNLIAPHIERVDRELFNTGRYKVDFFLWGLLWVYGCIPASKVHLQLMKELGDLEAMHFMKRLFRYLPIEDCSIMGYYVNPAIDDVYELLEERDARGFDGVSFAKYSVSDLMKIGSTGPYFQFGKGGKEYEDAFSALKDCGFDDIVIRSKLSALLCYVQNIRANFTLKEILAVTVGDTKRFIPTRKFERISAALFAYMKKLPRWIHGGHESKDLEVSEEQFFKLAGNLAAQDLGLESSEYRKVGRNDPCPCGSGLKYKKCHGKNV